MAAVRRAAADPDPGCPDPAAADWREGRRMTGRIAIILLVLAAFLVAAFVLKLERRSWTTLGAVLTFGLAGYALQGSPQLPSASKSAAGATAQSGEAMVAARRSLFDPAQPVPSYLMVSDGFARQGRYRSEEHTSELQ